MQERQRDTENFVHFSSRASLCQFGSPPIQKTPLLEAIEPCGAILLHLLELGAHWMLKSSKSLPCDEELEDEQRPIEDEEGATEEEESV